MCVSCYFLFCFSVEEQEVLKDLVEKALTCKARAIEIVDFALAFIDKDLQTISGKLTAAFKVFPWTFDLCFVNHF